MKLERTGMVELRLCEGSVPQYKEMVKLSAPIIEALIDEFGTQEVIKRFSNPCWFQSLACAMGFEHNFTGATTVTLKALKEVLSKENLGINVLGGKGRESRNTLNEIILISDVFNLKESKLSSLTYASKMTCKVDQTAIQDSFCIYFHSLVLDEKGNFAVINQGMNINEQLVRRYHWINAENFIEEPHSGMAGRTIDLTLDFTLKDNKEVQDVIVDFVQDNKPEKIKKIFLLLDRKEGQKKLLELSNVNVFKIPYYLDFPKRLNKQALNVARETQTFEGVLGTKGMGPSTLRGLAYISSLIYGTKLHWQEPQRYCYSFGTKCGKPWYIERKNMREAAEILKTAVENAKIGNRERIDALRKLKEFIPD